MAMGGTYLYVERVVVILLLVLLLPLALAASVAAK
jgi:hypothetical protein